MLYLRDIARAVAPRDPYPMETTSADRVLAGPTPEQEFRFRQRERGLTEVVCGRCGGRAWQEPPCWVNGVETRVVRCQACDSGRACVVCRERPPRYRRDHCAQCWRKTKEVKEMSTATKNGKAAKTCPYCNKGFDPIRSTQISCGSDTCKKAHQCHLHKHPASSRLNLVPAEKESSAATGVQGEGVQAPPAAGLDKPSEDVRQPVPASSGQQAGPLGVAPTLLEAEPVVAKSYGLTVDQLDEAMDRATGCPILRAVEAMEAVPREKHIAIMDVLEARYQAKLAAARADGLLQALGVA